MENSNTPYRPATEQPVPLNTNPQQQPLNATPLPQKSSKRLLVLVVVLVFALVATAAGAIYGISKANKTAESAKSELGTVQAAQFRAESLLLTEQAEKNFVTTYNDAQLSGSLCAGNRTAVFDVHINRQFAVFRYLCENQSHPARVAAMKAVNNGESYEFTYGASTQEPNNLPSYIFDTDADFFSTSYGAIRF